MLLAIPDLAPPVVGLAVLRPRLLQDSVAQQEEAFLAIRARAMLSAEVRPLLVDSAQAHLVVSSERNPLPRPQEGYLELPPPLNPHSPTHYSVVELPPDSEQQRTRRPAHSAVVLPLAEVCLEAELPRSLLVVYSETRPLPPMPLAVRPREPRVRSEVPLQRPLLALVFLATLLPRATPVEVSLELHRSSNNQLLLPAASALALGPPRMPEAVSLINQSQQEHLVLLPQPTQAQAAVSSVGVRPRPQARLEGLSQQLAIACSPRSRRLPADCSIPAQLDRLGPAAVCSAEA